MKVKKVSFVVKDKSKMKVKKVTFIFKLLKTIQR